MKKIMILEVDDTNDEEVNDTNDEQVNDTNDEEVNDTNDEEVNDTNVDFRDLVMSTKGPDSPIVIVGNKTDLDRKISKVKYQR